MSGSNYLDVLKATYTYEPQSEDELAITEDQLLFLLERTDDDWWKVKAKDDSGEGLVPSAYLEPAPHTSVVKVLYDYEAGAPGELSVQEEDTLLVYDQDEDWLLVKCERDGKLGFVPENYVGEGTQVDEPSEEPAQEEPVPSSSFDLSKIVVPPAQPARPVSTYVDPEERVRMSRSRTPTQVDTVVTWSVSELDKKGKKKKGTLGVGRGDIFFASESDKTPVQKWPITDVESFKIEKPKHLLIEFRGSESLHFHTGSKDTAEAIVAKLESSQRLAASSPPPEEQEDSHPKKNGINVHFSTGPPSIISPREPSEDEYGQGEEFPAQEPSVEPDSPLDGETAAVLYDFEADGDDELTVQEGEQLVVLDRSSDEWWKVRNLRGEEGVVPAEYVELANAPEPTTNGTHDTRAAEQAAARAAAEEAKREAAERTQREAERREREKTEAEHAERERKKAETQRRAREEAEAVEAQRRAKAEAEQKEMERKKRADKDGERRRREQEARSSKSQSPDGATSPTRDGTRRSKSAPPKDLPKNTRVWHDRTGQFQVEAEFLGFRDSKLRLHKINGVVIEVPAEKMSNEDMAFIESLKKPSANRKLSEDDDEPLAVRRRSLQPEAKSAPTPPAAAARNSPQPPKRSNIDWFEFFLNAGCEIDDCTRYASSFERDKIDENILPDITESTMRSLGLREGDIIRVKKAIENRSGTPKPNELAREAQLRRDEELARQLQLEENSGKSHPTRSTTSPAPNLFSTPGGELKNNKRRGRPTPSKSTPPVSVDINAISTASEQMTSPSVTLTTSPTSVVAPPRASSAAGGAGGPPPASVGFDDDAWTPRPSSTKPSSTPTPVISPRAPSAPPTQTAPVPPPPPPPPPVPAQTVPAAPPIATSPPAAPPAPVAPVQVPAQTGLAQTTESDLFNQIARLSSLRSQNPALQTPPIQNTNSAPAALASPPTMPPGFQQGMSMGTSPVPLGQLQPSLPPPQPQINGPRGPFAPVPGNQSLLQPLVPTNTGFNSFVPTRSLGNPTSFSPPPSFNPQPSFLSTQPTGFPVRPLSAQPTGFVPNSSPLFSQPTGMPGSFPINSPPANNTFGGGLQPQPTGFNPGANFLAQASFGPQGAPPPPPPPPAPSSPSVNANPANIFAQMKSGTFGADDAPQPANRYDALRPQPTGWGMQGVSGYQTGYSGFR